MPPKNRPKRGKCYWIALVLSLSNMRKPIPASLPEREFSAWSPDVVVNKSFALWSMNTESAIGRLNCRWNASASSSSFSSSSAGSLGPEGSEPGESVKMRLPMKFFTSSSDTEVLILMSSNLRSEIWTVTFCFSLSGQQTPRRPPALPSAGGVQCGILCHCPFELCDCRCVGHENWLFATWTIHVRRSTTSFLCSFKHFPTYDAHVSVLVIPSDADAQRRGLALARCSLRSSALLEWFDVGANAALLVQVAVTPETSTGYVIATWTNLVKTEEGVGVGEKLRSFTRCDIESFLPLSSTRACCRDLSQMYKPRRGRPATEYKFFEFDI